MISTIGTGSFLKATSGLPTDQFFVLFTTGASLGLSSLPLSAHHPDYDYGVAQPYQAYQPQTWAQDAYNPQRDCNRGRLIGGLLGGGLGYVASRDDGRAWAIPLGALLGSQVGCNAGVGRSPVPW